MYGRFENGIHPKEPLNDLLLANQHHLNSLEDHVQYLTKRIVNFKNLISSSAKRLHGVKQSKQQSNDKVDNAQHDDRW